MPGNILVKEQDVRGNDPEGVYDPEQQTMQKILAATALRNGVCAIQKNGQPERRLNLRGNDVHRGDSHRQPEERQLKDQFPVHGGVSCGACGGVYLKRARNVTSGLKRSLRRKR